MPRGVPTIWTEARKAQARALLSAGHKSPEVAARISAESGQRVTDAAVRNAVRNDPGFLEGSQVQRSASERPKEAAVVPQSASAHGTKPGVTERASTQLMPAPSVHNCSVRRRAFSVERILVIPDAHFPFVDERAWAVAMKAGRAFKPDRVINLGDLWDMYAVSDFPKSPERKTNPEAEIGSGCEALDEMASLGASRLDICLGNHCFRWDRYLTKNAPEMYNFLRFEEVVRFKERGWNVTPYKKHLAVGKMNFTHEVGYSGKQAHTQSRMEFEGNCVIGHTHGLASEYRNNLLNSPHVGIQLGWLGNREAIDYAHQRRAAAWVHAFGLAYHEPNGNVHVLPTPIVQGRAMVEGQLIEVAGAVRSQAA